MSYPAYDLDNFHTDALLVEYNRRHKRFKDGVCWYCNRPLKTQRACIKTKVHLGEDI